MGTKLRIIHLSATAGFTYGPRSIGRITGLQRWKVIYIDSSARLHTIDPWTCGDDSRFIHGPNDNESRFGSYESVPSSHYHDKVLWQKRRMRHCAHIIQQAPEICTGLNLCMIGIRLSIWRERERSSECEIAWKITLSWRP